MMYEDLERHYRDNFDMYVKMMTKRCKGVMNAEDVVQEAFVHAMRYWESYDSSFSSLSTWFNRILFQTFSKMRGREWDSVEIEEYHLVSIDMDDEEGSKDRIEKAKKAISSVANEGHKDVLYLSLIAGLDAVDVARHTNETVHNVRSIVKRFRKDMRDSL